MIARLWALYGGASIPVRAAVLACLAMLSFAAMTALIRQASSEMHIFQVVFFRNAFALLFMLPWLLQQGVGVLRTGRIRLYGLRALVNLVGMIAGFTALTMIPLAEATALSFTIPLFATFGAALVLRELVGPRRWMAIIVGFLGTLIILRPGIETFSLGAGLALLNALSIAITILIVKSLTRTERPETIVTYMVLLMTPISLIPALFVWQAPGFGGVCWGAGVAAAGTLGHLFITRAYALSPIAPLQPFEFIRLPLIAVIAFLAFGEVPTLWTWLGGTVIFTAALYVTHREAVRARLC